MDNKKEYILCAAIKRITPKDCHRIYWQDKCDIYDIELGWRPGDILHRFSGEVSKSPDAQGFYTSLGRFVDREEAAKIAYNCGQIEQQCRILYSEDLY